PISVVEVQDRSLRVTLPATVTLSASLAARPSPDTTGFLQFFWQQVEGSPVSLSLPLAVVEELQSSTVFEPATAGVFEFDCLVQEQDELGQSTGVELGRRIRVVVDGLDNGVPVSVAVPRSLDAKASPAGANEPAVVRVASGGRVQLDGGRSRDLGAGADLSLFYQWTQISGPPVVLSNPFATLTTFVSPVFQDMSRPLVFALFVDDGSIRSAPALAVVEVQATSRLSSRLDLGGGANFIGVGVAPRGGPGTYYASDLALDTGASMLVRLETTPAGRRFRTFFAETGERGFLVQGNEGYLLLGSGGAQRRSLFGSAWDPSQLQRQLADGLNLVAMPRGVPEDFTVKSLATLTGARFVAYTEAVGGRARTTVYVPGLSQTSPAVVSGKSYLLSVSGSPVVSLPGR
ncbi:MAG: hypothetical protein HYY25_05600, partial [Candidatus Wallbacteria bacterium]|nr:hypothetical protein [Candidatus Wallbacteria bacterium]